MQCKHCLILMIYFAFRNFEINDLIKDFEIEKCIKKQLFEKS